MSTDTLNQATLDNLKLSQFGITSSSELFYNLSYEDLFQHETNPENEHYENYVK